jgi:hypothetical protein
MTTFPRLTAEFTTPDLTEINTGPDHRDYEALAQATRNLTRVSWFEVVFAEGVSKVTLTHDLGVVPNGISIMKVDRIDGDVWYDSATLSDTIADIYVENPPLPGETFTIKLAIYYTIT